MDEKKLVNHIESYIERSTEVMKSLKGQSKTIKDIAVVLAEARDNGKHVFIMGNGGSASTASHMANDLNKTAMVKDRKRFKAISLTDNVPVILAWGNDDSYEVIFVEQLKNFLEKGDVVVGISGSGNSPNVLKAIEYANSNGNTTIGITGIGGGKLKHMAKLSLVIQDDLMYRVEDFHLMLNHIITYAFKHHDE